MYFISRFVANFFGYHCWQSAPHLKKRREDLQIKLLQLNLCRSRAGVPSLFQAVGEVAAVTEWVLELGLLFKPWSPPPPLQRRYLQDSKLIRKVWYAPHQTARMFLLRPLTIS